LCTRKTGLKHTIRQQSGGTGGTGKIHERRTQQREKKKRSRNVRLPWHCSGRPIYPKGTRMKKRIVKKTSEPGRGSGLGWFTPPYHGVVLLDWLERRRVMLQVSERWAEETSTWKNELSWGTTSRKKTKNREQGEKNA